MSELEDLEEISEQTKFHATGRDRRGAREGNMGKILKSNKVNHASRTKKKPVTLQKT